MSVEDPETFLVQLMIELNELEGHERHAALLAWVRSDWWSAVLMICEGWQGKIAREAYRALKAEREVDTPGRRWASSDIQVGRASITRLLCPEVGDGAFYACFPFRTYWTQEDEPWIGAAIGCEPLFDVGRRGAWEHLDITDVLLWDPKSNAVRLAGDASSKGLVVPYCVDPVLPLQIYDSPLDFLRAWAAERLNIWALWKRKKEGKWVHEIHEPRDGGVPGALALGGIAKQPWTSLGASTLVAPPGTSERDMRRVIFASAHLPSVEKAARASV